MPSAGARQAMGFILAGLISVPLLFFGWWTVCFVDLAVALVLVHVPQRFGARGRDILIFGSIVLVALGVVIGISERKGLVGPGPTGLEEMALGALDGLWLVTIPAIIVFGAIYIFNVYPFGEGTPTEDDGSAEAASEDVEDEVDDIEDTATSDASGPSSPGRICPNCGTLIVGSEERCWYCRKRV